MYMILFRRVTKYKKWDNYIFFNKMVQSNRVFSYKKKFYTENFFFEKLGYEADDLQNIGQMSKNCKNLLNFF
jgi:hypothetical protein